MVLIRHIHESGDGLRVFCEAVGCGHWSDLDPLALMTGWGESVTVADIKAKMRCTACGRRSVAMQRVVRTPEPDLKHTHSEPPS